MALTVRLRRDLFYSSRCRPQRKCDRLLNESCQIKRRLTSKITNVNLDETYEAALGVWALGLKLLGADGGGSMLFFVPSERQGLRDRLKKLLCVPFWFSSKGSHVVVYEPERINR